MFEYLNGPVFSLFLLCLLILNDPQYMKVKGRSKVSIRLYKRNSHRHNARKPVPNFLHKPLVIILLSHVTLFCSESEGVKSKEVI